MTKINYEIAKKRFEEKGLKLLSKKYINNHHLMDCEDEQGYRFNISINELVRFTKTKMVYAKNKWSLYNINIYIKNEGISSNLLSTKYKGSKVPLSFRCNCGKVFFKSWNDFYGKGHTFCNDCAKKESSKKLDVAYIEREFLKHGYIVIDKNDYHGNNIPMECLTLDGYKIKKSYSNLYKDIKPNIFSYTYNKNNYVYNVNNYLALNSIDLACLKLLNYKCGEHGQYYIEVKCSCGNIYKTTIDYIRRGSICCPLCSKYISSSERQIKDFLDRNEIKNMQQYKFAGCRYKRALPFDFYLPEYNTCIEFDGAYHYKKQPHVTEKQFEEQIIRDKIKDEFCKRNGIKLIRIPYFNFNRKQLKKIIIEELPSRINEP